jgi:hypothetical protein
MIALVASMAWAGGPPGRGRGDRGRGDRGRGGFDMFSMMRGRREDTDIFRMAQRYVQLTDEQRATLEKLDGKRDAEERAARAELDLELDKKYIALLLEIVQGPEKDKLEKAFAARTERDAAIAAARAELLALFAKLDEESDAVEATRDPDYIPYSKTDLIRRFIKLSDAQGQAVDGVRRAAFNGLREKMRGVQRPQDWRNAEAREKYIAAMRTAREEVDEETVVKMVEQLTEPQIKAYETLSAALDAYNKKVKEAEEAYAAKVAEAGLKPLPRTGGEQPRGRTEF